MKSKIVGMAGSAGLAAALGLCLSTESLFAGPPASTEPQMDEAAKAQREAAGQAAREAAERTLQELKELGIPVNDPRAQELLGTRIRDAGAQAWNSYYWNVRPPTPPTDVSREVSTGPIPQVVDTPGPNGKDPFVLTPEQVRDMLKNDGERETPHNVAERVEKIKNEKEGSVAADVSAGPRDGSTASYAVGPASNQPGPSSAIRALFQAVGRESTHNDGDKFDGSKFGDREPLLVTSPVRKGANPQPCNSGTKSCVPTDGL